MKRFLLIAILAIFATAACSDKNNEPGPIPQELPEVTIVAVPEDLDEHMIGSFHVSLNEAAKEEVLITINNTYTDIIKIAADEIRIPAGETASSVGFLGKNFGIVDIKFSSVSAIVLTPIVTVYVPLVD